MSFKFYLFFYFFYKDCIFPNDPIFFIFFGENKKRCGREKILCVGLGLKLL